MVMHTLSFLIVLLDLLHTNCQHGVNDPAHPSPVPRNGTGQRMQIVNATSALLRASRVVESNDAQLAGRRSHRVAKVQIMPKEPSSVLGRNVSSPKRKVSSKLHFLADEATRSNFGKKTIANDPEQVDVDLDGDALAKTEMPGTGTNRQPEKNTETSYRRSSQDERIVKYKPLVISGMLIIVFLFISAYCIYSSDKTATSEDAGTGQPPADLQIPPPTPLGKHVSSLGDSGLQTNWFISEQEEMQLESPRSETMSQSSIMTELDPGGEIGPFTMVLVIISEIVLATADLVCAQLSLSEENNSGFIGIGLVTACMGLTLNQILTLLNSGVEGWKEIWNLKNIGVFVVPGISGSLSCLMKFWSLGLGMQADTVTVTLRFSLVLVAVGMNFVGRRKLKRVQWGLISIIMMGILEFSRMKYRVIHGLDISQTLPAGSTFKFAQLSLLGACTLDLLGSMTEYLALKRTQAKTLLVVKNYYEVPTLLLIVPFYIIINSGSEMTTLLNPCKGWGVYTWGVCFIMLAKSWMACFFVKNFGPLAKQLMKSVSVVLCYFSCCIFLPSNNQFTLDSFIVCLIIAVGVATFAVSENSM